MAARYIQLLENAAFSKGYIKLKGVYVVKGYFVNNLKTEFICNDFVALCLSWKVLWTVWYLQHANDIKPQILSTADDGWLLMKPNLT